MKIIYLDIDGVLNCESSPIYIYEVYVGIDEDKLQQLKRIIDATGAEIILTSTWKTRWFKNPEDKDFQDAFGDEIDKRFSAIGLSILNRTWEKDLYYRGHGIKSSVQKYNPEAWVVLDDEYFPDFAECGIDEHLVKTDWYELGLTAEKADLAIKVLNENIKIGGFNYVKMGSHIGK